MKVLDVTVEFHGPAALHNMPCAVYRDKHAVLHTNTGIMHPSWAAQADGWRLVRLRHKWLAPLLLVLTKEEP